VTVAQLVSLNSNCSEYDSHAARFMVPQVSSLLSQYPTINHYPTPVTFSVQTKIPFLQDVLVSYSVSNSALIGYYNNENKATAVQRYMIICNSYCSELAYDILHSDKLIEIT
jgi:hypothetical protein